MGECPTTRALERRGAELLGFEDAMFVPTGTQANLCAVGTHCTRGDEVILGSKSHIYLWEAGSTSALLGASTCVIPNESNGTFDLEAAGRGVRVGRLFVASRSVSSCTSLLLTPQPVTTDSW